MDPISAAGGRTDGALAPSASSASSVDLATISSSSLACKASADQNFLDSMVKVAQAVAGEAELVLTRAQRRKATVPRYILKALTDNLANHILSLIINEHCRYVRAVYFLLDFSLSLLD